MRFESLKEKCEYYRSLTDYRLLPNSYVLAMIDGRAFSKAIKNRYKRPFDDEFITMMNETAKYVAKNIQGCKFAYVQSDEISFVISDNDTIMTDSFFGYRLCKLQSLIASMATAKFNQLSMERLIMTPCSQSDMVEMVKNAPLYQFDCKVWNVPSYNDVYAWLLYRQIDCIRNSKQQTAQTYLPHNRLKGLHTDEQVALLKSEKGVDWNTDFNDGEKYGRFIYKETNQYFNEKMNTYFTRETFESHYGFKMNDDDGRERFDNIFLTTNGIKDENKKGKK